MEKLEACERYKEIKLHITYLQDKRKKHLIKANNLITKFIHQASKLLADINFEEVEQELKEAQYIHDNLPGKIRAANEYAEICGEPELSD